MTGVVVRAAGATSLTCPADDRIPLKVTGYSPAERVQLTATMVTGDGQRWMSGAEFTCDEHGRVDPAVSAPHGGSYRGIDVTGLLWSMRPEPTQDGRARRFTLRELSPLHVQVTAEPVSGPAGRVGAVEITRLVLPSSVTVQRFDEPGSAGMLFRPAGQGRHPVVVVLGGSAGGIRAPHAALLARHGFAALAVAYFGAGPLPRELAQVPLEFWQRARSWLGQQHGCDLSRLAMLGSSKGAELALLLASTFPEQIAAVVAYAPSAVVYEGIPSFRRDAPPLVKGPVSSWTLGGAQVPFLRFTASSAAGTGIGPLVGPSAGSPMSLRQIHENALTRLAADDPAVIPVERIAGPVLLVSGTDDEVWPSARLAEMVTSRLARHGRSQAVTHLSYKGAGHHIGIPYLPTTGGGPSEEAAAATAAANADSWSKVLDFLHASLRPGSSVDGPAQEAPATGRPEYGDGQR